MTYTVYEMEVLKLNMTASTVHRAVANKINIEGWMLQMVDFSMVILSEHAVFINLYYNCGCAHMHIYVVKLRSIAHKIIHHRVYWLIFMDGWWKVLWSITFCESQTSQSKYVPQSLTLSTIYVVLCTWADSDHRPLMFVCDHWDFWSQWWPWIESLCMNP